MKHSFKLIAAVAVASLASTIVIAPTANAATKQKVCVALDTGGINDKSFNQTSYAGALEARKKGFASSNVVYGIGSYTYQYNTRDTFGFALKSTACVIDGQEFQLFKNPKTDSGVKKSQKGRVAVFQEHGKIYHKEEYGLKDQIAGDLLQEVFRNGKILVDESLTDIRKRVHSYL